MTSEEMAGHHRSLAGALDALAARDYDGAKARLDALHEAAHDVPSIHREVHVWTLRLHLARGDRRAALGEILPILFAPTVARFERLVGRRNPVGKPRA